MQSFLPHDVKDQNRKIIFDILLQESELAKVEVTEKTTMSFVTVSKIIDYFESIGIVTISGESREGSGGLGRKRVIYRFNHNRYLTVGIQIIGSQMSAVLVNLKSEILAIININKTIYFSKEGLLPSLEEVIQSFKIESEALGASIIGVGLGIDGALNKQRKTIRLRTDEFLEEDYEYEVLLKQLEDCIGLPIIIENDVNASTIAEFSYLDKEEATDLLQIALGEGIGAGMILDKKLYRGRTLGAGELEYMCFDPDYVSPKGSIGWLESKLNLEYLKQTYGLCWDSPQSMSQVNKTECVKYISKYLALVICNTLSVLNIESVILSGKTIHPFPCEVVTKTEQYIKQYTGWELQLTVSDKQHSTAVGAAILALESEMVQIISG